MKWATSLRLSSSQICLAKVSAPPCRQHGVKCFGRLQQAAQCPARTDSQNAFCACLAVHCGAPIVTDIPSYPSADSCKDWELTFRQFSDVCADGVIQPEVVKLVDIVLQAEREEDVHAWLASNQVKRSELALRDEQSGAAALAAGSAQAHDSCGPVAAAGAAACWRC